MRQEDIDQAMEIADSAQRLRSRYLLLCSAERRLRRELNQATKDRFETGEMLARADVDLLAARARLETDG